MDSRTKRTPMTWAALGLATSLVLAACAGDDGGGTGGGGGGDQAGEPERGGTLKIVGKGDVTSMDTAFSYYTLNYAIMRGFTRQLVTYPTTNNVDEAGQIVADMATEVPTVDNGGISSDRLTYTFTIKEGVQWNTSPPRQVTAADMERGIERLCNPVKPSGALSYYTSTISGMQQYCDGLSQVEGTAQAIGGYIRDNSISGINVVDERTIEFTLSQPAPDFLNIMAEYFATPAPEEYLQYVPSSQEFNQNVLSNGPYQVATYDPGNEIVLERNSAWNADTDDVREAYLDTIHVQEGLSQQSAYQQVSAGTADLLWDTPPPTAQLPTLYEDERLELVENGLFNKYIVFNMVSPNENSAMSKPAVRKAINFAVDKQAIIQVYGGPQIATPACQIMPETSRAHLDDFECPYATEDSAGDPDRAQQLLAEAGYPNGLTLKMKYRNTGNHPEVAETLKDSLSRAGITLQTQPVPGDDFYSGFLQVPDNARRGAWDIAAPGWIPDWFGLNGRTYLQPLFYSANLSRDASSWGTNYGFYNSEEVNTLIDQATTAENPDDAAAAFADAQRQIIEEAAIVPVMWQKNPQLHSRRVEGFAGYPNAIGDITHMWLSE
ncbi:peptide/nickel transport system substrate-binding protein [Haloactinopolyspora alba]|uniref:Peptide/nickel transport system substrate-binding protein n=1 Tax=Haloactinopolyspora alba TaxID=648780 RepID=A0A2P8E7N9_9ACTN|nr:ABC transporter substrate-binding protein [Haloactinopolyspora alba]PSL05482.1 peptide/nickel transport system substrate-binding protein [Haloactinopolyspora alba]